MKKKRKKVLIVFQRELAKATTRVAEVLGTLGIESRHRSYTCSKGMHDAHALARRARKNGYATIIVICHKQTHVAEAFARATTLPVYALLVYELHSAREWGPLLSSFIRPATGYGAPALLSDDSSFDSDTPANIALQAAKVLALDDPNLSRRIEKFVKKHDRTLGA